MIEHDMIHKLVPHAGDMCLIERVDHWDATTLLCRAHTGEPAVHPLGVDDGLPATALAEYGAQAMAVHGALLAGDDAPPRAGLLVALRGLELAVDRLTAPSELTIRAHRAGGDDHGASYDFDIHSEGRRLARGTATVMFPDPDSLP